MSEPSTALRRVLGFWSVTASGVGIIIGAGIYVLVGPATALAGNRVWLSFVVAAVLSALTGLCYAELASMFPKAGAEFEYTRQVFPAWVAFLVGWTMIVGLVVATAAVALGFGRTVQWLLPVQPWIAALGLMVAITGIGLVGIKKSSAVTLVLSVVQVGGLLLVIAIGIPHLGHANLLSSEGRAGSGVFSAAALAFFAFIGFDEVITLSEETTHPSRTIPRALLAALGISTLLYVGVAVTSVNVLGSRALGASSQPLAEVLGHALGRRGGDVVAVIALIATFNTSLLALTAASRLQYGMATSGAFPKVLGRLSARTRVPNRAIMAAATLSSLFILMKDLSLIASVTDFAVYVVFIAVDLSVIVLRFTKPEHARPFRVPGTLRRVPVIPVAGLVAVFVMVPSLPWRSVMVGVSLCVLGVVLYGVGHAVRRHQESSHATAR